MTLTLRQHWIAFSGLFTLIVIVSAFYLLKLPVLNFFQETSRQAGFVLETLTVEGLERTARNDVLARLDMDAGMPLMAVNLDEVQRSIEALPWVKRAVVTRVLPGDIKIVVEERIPFALWQMDQRLALIDGEGTVIIRSSLASFADLPIVVGSFDAADMQALFSMVSETPSLLGQVRSLIRVGERRWDIVFENGVRLKLPADQALTYNSQMAWEKFIELEQKHRLLAREVSVIDMRIKDRLIMRVTPAGRRVMDGKEWAT